MTEDELKQDLKLLWPKVSRKSEFDESHVFNEDTFVEHLFKGALSLKEWGIVNNNSESRKYLEEIKVNLEKHMTTYEQAEKLRVYLGHSIFSDFIEDGASKIDQVLRPPELTSSLTSSHIWHLHNTIPIELHASPDHLIELMKEFSQKLRELKKTESKLLESIRQLCGNRGSSDGRSRAAFALGYKSRPIVNQNRAEFSLTSLYIAINKLLDGEYAPDNKLEHPLKILSSAWNRATLNKPMLTSENSPFYSYVALVFKFLDWPTPAPETLKMRHIRNLKKSKLQN